MLDGENPARKTFTAVDQVSPANIGTGDRTLGVLTDPSGSVLNVEISLDGVTWYPYAVEGVTREYTATGFYHISLCGLHHVRIKCATYVTSCSAYVSCN